MAAIWGMDEFGNLTFNGKTINFSELVRNNGSAVVDIDGSPIAISVADADKVGGKTLAEIQSEFTKHWIITPGNVVDSWIKLCDISGNGGESFNIKLAVANVTDNISGNNDAPMIADINLAIGDGSAADNLNGYMKHNNSVTDFPISEMVTVGSGVNWEVWINVVPNTHIVALLTGVISSIDTTTAGYSATAPVGGYSKSISNYSSLKDAPISVSKYDDTTINVLMPQGGLYSADVIKTGAIKITLPVSWTSTMIRFTIRIYDHTEDKSFDVNISGTNEMAGAWDKPSVQIIGSVTDRAFTVRFGHDGTKCCIYIGELTSTWQYPQIAVIDFIGGKSNATKELWATGWAIGFETTAFGTITATKSGAGNFPQAYNADTIDGFHALTLGRQVFKTINTGTSSNQYSKVARITLPSQFVNSNHVFEIISDGDASGSVFNEKIALGIKQQLAIGNNPYVELTQYRTDVYTAFTFGYVIVQNTPTVIIDIYCKILPQYTTCIGYRVSGDDNDYTEFYNNNTLTATEPTGIVYATKNTLWHSGNDGPSSGLVADKLDDLEGNDYARSYNTLNNWPAPMSLTNTISVLGVTADPDGAYVLLCLAYDGTLKNKSFCIGRVSRHRGDASSGSIITEVNLIASSAYNANIANANSFGNIKGDLYLVTYNAVKYIALYMPIASSSTISCDLRHTSDFTPILVADGLVTSATLLSYVNNADLLDGHHANEFKYVNYTVTSNMTFDNGSTTKTSSNSLWDGSIYSNIGYQDGAIVEFSPNATSYPITIGLNTDPTTDNGYTGIDYAIYLKSNATIDIIESNSSVGTFGAYAAGDSFSIIYDGYWVLYIRNGTILRRVAVGAGKKLYMDSSFYTVASNQTRYLNFKPYTFGLMENNTTVFTGDLNTLTKAGSYDVSTPTNNPASSQFGGLLVFGNSNHLIQMYVPADSPHDVWVRAYNGSWTGWGMLWSTLNDGSDLGLNADLLAGLSIANFMLTSLGLTDLNYTSFPGVFEAGPTTLNTPVSGNNFGVCNFRDMTNNSIGIQIATDDATDIVYIRTATANGWSSWAPLWHGNNDGSGSLLDADLLDGIDSTGFMKSGPDFTGDVNTLFTPGGYRVSSTSTNIPVSGRIYAAIVLGNGGNVTAQIFTDYITGETYTRAYNSAWSAWRKQIDTSNDGDYERFNYSTSPNATFDNGVAGKINSANWDGSIYSNVAYKDGAIVEWSPTATTNAFMVGLNTDPTTSTSYTDIDFCIYIQADAGLMIYENGSSVGAFGTYAAGDSFAIVFDGYYIIYIKNNAILRRVAVGTTKTFYMDSSFATINSNITKYLRFRPFSIRSHSLGSDIYTLAQRDGAGDITTRLFRSTYAEQTSALAATADIAFRVDSATDNYIRFVTQGAFIKGLTNNFWTSIWSGSLVGTTTLSGYSGWFLVKFNSVDPEITHGIIYHESGKYSSNVARASSGLSYQITWGASDIVGIFVMNTTTGASNTPPNAELLQIWKWGDV